MVKMIGTIIRLLVWHLLAQSALNKENISDLYNFKCHIIAQCGGAGFSKKVCNSKLSQLHLGDYGGSILIGTWPHFFSFFLVTLPLYTKMCFLQLKHHFFACLHGKCVSQQFHWKACVCSN